MSIRLKDVLDAIDHRGRQVHEGEMGLWVRVSEWDIVREAMRHSPTEAEGEGWDAINELSVAMVERVSHLERNGSVTTISSELTKWLDVIHQLKMKRRNAPLESK